MLGEQLTINSLYPENNQDRDNEISLTINEKEHDFYSKGNLSYKNMIVLLQSLSDDTPNEELENTIQLFEAMRHHHNANIDFVKFNQQLGKKYQNKIITRKKYENELSLYENKDQLLENEQKAIELYEQALQNLRKSMFVNAQDIELLILDLKERQAQRIQTPEERENALKQIEENYKLVIDDIEDQGKRAEAIIIWILNQKLRKEDLGHMLNISHALPREDHHDKIDNVLVFGDKLININLKSFSNSSDVKDFNEKLIAKEEKKTKGTNVQIVKLDSYELSNIQRLLSKDNPSRGDKIQIGKISNAILQSLLSPIGGSEILKKERRERKEPTKKELLEFFRKVPQLIKLEYLDQDDSMNIEAILQAQKDLQKDLKTPKKRQEIAKLYKKMQNTD